MRILQIFILFFIFETGQSAILNGDFSSGTDWVDTGLSGTATIGNGIAILSTEGNGSTGLYSGSLSQGTDASFSTFNSTTVVDGNWLNFDFLFDGTVADPSESGSSTGNNYFSVTLLTQSDFNNFSTGLSFTGGLDFLLTASFASLDVSSYLNETVIISFDMFDEADDFDSILKLDNVEFSNTARTSAINTFASQTGNVPEPSTIALLIVGLLLISRFYIQGLNSSKCGSLE